MLTDTMDVADGEVPASELVVTHEVAPSDLRRLFSCLHQEGAVHSWKNVGAEGQHRVEGLLEWENRRRPTQLFFFHVAHGDQLHLVAAAAVAETLTRTFPYPGFCVLSRCYIMPEFRGRGLYRRVLRHRLEYCRARLGDALRAIHIGTADPRIARAITTQPAPGWPAFTHLGKEELRVAGQTSLVHDYLLFVPEYVQRLQRALVGAGAPTCVVELREEVARIGFSDRCDLGVSLKKKFDEACAAGWFDDHDPLDFEQLLLFCRSIPLVGFG